MAEPVTLEGLTIRVGDRTLVDSVSLAFRPGELTGLVGASGSGKTLTCRSLLGLVDVGRAAEWVAARLRKAGMDAVVSCPPAGIRWFTASASMHPVSRRS